MNGRTLLSVCAGVLLPVPLVVLLGMLLHPEQALEAETGARISPMLDGEQRMRLVTYRRDCETSAECEPPLGCLYSFRYWHAYCIDSECLTDAQCPEGQVCLKLATQQSGPLVRQCIPVGMRQEGENCHRVPEDQKGACAAGLVCAGRYAWCALPCHLDTPEECPEGFFCADTTPEPACLPTCEKRGCPAGQQCIQFLEGASQCMQVYGTNCQESPCPEGRQCQVMPDPPHPGKAWLWCVEKCGKDRPPCPTGKVCSEYECVPACDPQDPAACAEGFRCRKPWPDSPFGCQPDW
jgi:Cys-rich repeat protein